MSVGTLIGYIRDVQSLPSMRVKLFLTPWDVEDDAWGCTSVSLQLLGDNVHVIYPLICIGIMDASVGFLKWKGRGWYTLCISSGGMSKEMSDLLPLLIMRHISICMHILTHIYPLTLSLYSNRHTCGRQQENICVLCMRWTKTVKS